MVGQGLFELSTHVETFLTILTQLVNSVCHTVNIIIAGNCYCETKTVFDVKKDKYPPPHRA